MDDDHILPSAPRDWLEALAEGEADLAAGRSSPWPEARARLVALQDQLRTEQVKRKA